MLREEMDEDFVPSDKEVQDYALWLGMDVEKDADLLWIARKGLKSPVAPPWKPCRSRSGEVFYFNQETGESCWEHPSDEEHKQLYLREKERKSSKARGEEANSLSTTSELIFGSAKEGSSSSSSMDKQKPEKPPLGKPPLGDRGERIPSTRDVRQALEARFLNEGTDQETSPCAAEKSSTLSVCPLSAPLPAAVQPQSRGATADLDDLFEGPLELSAPIAPRKESLGQQVPAEEMCDDIAAQKADIAGKTFQIVAPQLPPPSGIFRHTVNDRNQGGLLRVIPQTDKLKSAESSSVEKQEVAAQDSKSDDFTGNAMSLKQDGGGAVPFPASCCEAASMEESHAETAPAVCTPTGAIGLRSSFDELSEVSSPTPQEASILVAELAPDPPLENHRSPRTSGKSGFPAHPSLQPLGKPTSLFMSDWEAVPKVTGTDVPKVADSMPAAGARECYDCDGSFLSVLDAENAGKIGETSAIRGSLEISSLSALLNHSSIEGGANTSLREELSKLQAMLSQERRRASDAEMESKALTTEVQALTAELQASTRECINLRNSHHKMEAGLADDVQHLKACLCEKQVEAARVAEQLRLSKAQEEVHKGAPRPKEDVRLCETLKHEKQHLRDEVAERDQLLKDLREVLRGEQAGHARTRASLHEGRREMFSMQEQLRQEVAQAESAASERQCLQTEMAVSEEDSQKLRQQLLSLEAEASELKARRRQQAQQSDAEFRRNKLELVEREARVEDRERFLDERERIADKAETMLRERQRALRLETQQAHLSGLKAVVSELATNEVNTVSLQNTARASVHAEIADPCAETLTRSQTTRSNKPTHLCTEKDREHKTGVQKYPSAGQQQVMEGAASRPQTVVCHLGIDEQTASPSSNGDGNDRERNSCLSSNDGSSAEWTSSRKRMPSLGAQTTSRTFEHGKEVLLDEPSESVGDLTLVSAVEWRRSELRHERQLLEEERRLWKTETAEARKSQCAGRSDAAGLAQLRALSEARAALDSKAASLNRAIVEQRTLERLVTAQLEQPQHALGTLGTVESAAFDDPVRRRSRRESSSCAATTRAHTASRVAHLGISAAGASLASKSAPQELGVRSLSARSRLRSRSMEGKDAMQAIAGGA